MQFRYVLGGIHFIRAFIVNDVVAGDGGGDKITFKKNAPILQIPRVSTTTQDFDS